MYKKATSITTCSTVTIHTIQRGNKYSRYKAESTRVLLQLHTTAPPSGQACCKKNYTTEDRRAGTTWGKFLQPDDNLNRCSCNQNPPFQDPDEARVGRRGQVNYGEQLVNIN